MFYARISDFFDAEGDFEENLDDLPEPGSLMDTYGIAYNRESYFR